MTRFLLACAIVTAGSAAVAAPPNVVVVVADDLGYADLGCYGGKTVNTPHLDSLAKQGVRFTDYYAAQPVCSASRAALLTGCYPNRLGIHNALGPAHTHGISEKETTLAGVLKAKGYATGIVGKWHLGHHPPFLPTRHGFDSYYGLPYSNDMWPNHPEEKTAFPPLPLFENETVVNKNVTAADQSKLTADYTARAVKFIAANKSRPFFLYLAHAMPHVPLFPGARFKNSGPGGTYGDVVREIDWSVGEVLAALKDNGVADNTLVVFTSDNGPWLSYGNHAGSAGPLREGKGTAFDGGVRVPFVARLPGVIPAGSVVREPAMAIDLLPTVAKLAGADLPKLPIDGKDIGPLLRAEPGAKCPHAAYYFYYKVNELHAVRAGKWKLTLPHTARTMIGQPAGADGTPGKYAALPVAQALYDLSSDIGETADVSAANPDVVKELLAHADRARADLGDALTNHPGPGRREPGRVK